MKIVVWKGNRSIMTEIWGSSLQDLARWAQTAQARAFWAGLRHGFGGKKVVVKIEENPAEVLPFPTVPQPETARSAQISG